MLTIAAAWISSTAYTQQSPSFITDSIGSYISQGMKDWQIPGLAIVIVKDGRPVMMKGFGVRAIDSTGAVDENTLFMIASNTKLFTGTILSKLDYEHKLSLDDKVTRYFPAYRLYDSITTSLLTIRDLLTHRIGTKTFQGDFTFWNSKLTRSEIMNKMRLLKPVGRFRLDYGYCNSCFLAAGEVVPKVTGISWEKYVQDSLLTPLQMKRSAAISAGIQDRENVARPYTNSFSESLKRVPYDRWDNLGPAASIVSSVHDLSHWLLMQLDSGHYNGKAVLPFAVLQQTRDVQIIVSSRKSIQLPIHFRGYGLGLFAADYNGRQIYWHTGGAAGMVSNVCFVPEEKLGIAILTNNDNQNFFEALRYQILDAYLGVPYVNRSRQSLRGFRQDRQEQLQQITDWRKRVQDNKTPLPLNAYTGEYRNELYGTMSITAEANRLRLRFNTHEGLTASLTYMDKNEWLLEYDNVEYGIFAIQFDRAGQRIQSVSIRANEFVEYDPYVFTKVLPAAH